MATSLDQLSTLERQIVERCQSGESFIVDLDRVDLDIIDGYFLGRLLLGGFDLEADSLRVLRVRGARIRGPLNIEGATSSFTIEFRECLFEDKVTLTNATLRDLAFFSTHFAQGIIANGVRIEGELQVTEGSICVGPLALEGATIGRLLRLTALTIYAPGTRALLLSRARVGGSVLASECVIDGQFRLISARIDGLLNLHGSVIVNTKGAAIEGERASVTESIFLQRGFRSVGVVAFDNAVVGGGFDAVGSRFQAGKTRRCLNLTRMRATRNVSFVDATLDGDARLQAIETGGTLRFKDTKFVGSDRSLDLDYSRSHRLGILFENPPNRITLRHSRHEILEDRLTSWSPSYAMSGASYSKIEVHGSAVLKERLKWLESDSEGYTSRSYEALATSFRNDGDDISARTVALKGQRARRGELRAYRRIPGYILDGLVGYGYRNWYAGIMLLSILFAATILLYVNKPTPGPDVVGRPAQPFFLALDLLLPIVDLGQEKNWVVPVSINWLPPVLVLLGWVLTTAIVAGLARLLNRTK